MKRKFGNILTISYKAIFMKLCFRLSVLAVFLAVALAGQFLLGAALMTVKDVPHGKALILENAEQLGDDNKISPVACIPFSRPADTSCHHVIITASHSWSLARQAIHATGPPLFYS